MIARVRGVMCCAHGFDADGPRIRIHVDHDRDRIALQDHGRRGEHREGGHDHLVAHAHAGGQQRALHGGRAIAVGDAEGVTEPLGPLPLQTAGHADRVRVVESEIEHLLDIFVRLRCHAWYGFPPAGHGFLISFVRVRSRGPTPWVLATAI